MSKIQKSNIKMQNSIPGTIVLIFISMLFGFQIPAACAETVSSNELIERANILDGKTVTYKGELVTAVLNRGGYSWVNLNDGRNAIGVWCDASMLKGVKFSGDYKHKGDVVEVTGVFHRACGRHGGELDIHADTVKLVERGFPIKEKIRKRRLDVAAGLFLAVLAILIIFRKRV